MAQISKRLCIFLASSMFVKKFKDWTKHHPNVSSSNNTKITFSLEDGDEEEEKEEEKNETPIKHPQGTQNTERNM